MVWTSRVLEWRSVRDRAGILRPARNEVKPSASALERDRERSNRDQPTEAPRTFTGVRAPHPERHRHEDGTETIPYARVGQGASDQVVSRLGRLVRLDPSNVREQ